MTDEKLRILKMLENGAITATQATDLLAALQEEPITASSITNDGPVTRAQWMKLLLIDRLSRKKKVNLRFPLALLPWNKMEKGLNINLGNKTDENGNAAFQFDKETVMHVMQMINKGEPGVIIDVEDEQSNERVLISLE